MTCLLVTLDREIKLRNLDQEVLEQVPKFMFLQLLMADPLHMLVVDSSKASHRTKERENPAVVKQYILKFKLAVSDKIESK